MTVRIHTESSKEAGSRVGRGGEKVQHSNNKMEGSSCIINHRNKQCMIHNERCIEKQRMELLCFSMRKLHLDHWNKVRCAAVSHVNEWGALRRFPLRDAVFKYHSEWAWLLENDPRMKTDDVHTHTPLFCASAEHVACLQSTWQDTESIDCEMAGDQIYWTFLFQGVR